MRPLSLQLQDIPAPVSTHLYHLQLQRSKLIDDCIELCHMLLWFLLGSVPEAGGLLWLECAEELNQ